MDLSTGSSEGLQPATSTTVAGESHDEQTETTALDQAIWSQCPQTSIDSRPASPDQHYPLRQNMLQSGTTPPPQHVASAASSIASGVDKSTVPQVNETSENDSYCDSAADRFVWVRKPPEDNPPVDDFVSCCKNIDKTLSSLNQKRKNKILSKDVLKAMKETRPLLDRKEINISVFGHHNSGKSTLLNALLGAMFLPVKRMSETSVRVKIQHDERVHERMCSKNCPHLVEKTCPKLVVKGMCGKEETYYGPQSIQEKLRALNAKVRKSKKPTSKVITLKVHFPLLAENAPPGWIVSLVDNTGFADVNRHISELAEASVVTSAAYIYLIETENISGSEDYKTFESLAEKDPKCITDDRLVIALTKFDLNYEDEIKQKVFVGREEAIGDVCENIKSATALDFQRRNVLTLCGEWALQSRMLDSCHPDDQPAYSRRVEAVKSCLKNYPRLADKPSGEDEKDISEMKPDQLVQHLDEASGLTVLRDRIQFMVSKGCVKIWAQKMFNEYSGYNMNANCGIGEEAERIKKKCDDKEKRHDTHKVMYDDILFRKKKLEGTITTDSVEMTALLHELDEGFLEDMKKTGIVESAKTVAEERMESFAVDCQKRIDNEHDIFGPTEFNEAMNRCIEDVTIELQKLFDKCQFTHLHFILRERAKLVSKQCAMFSERATFLFKMEVFRPENIKQALEVIGKEPQVSLTNMELLPDPPNLGDIKEKVPIPPVSLSLWGRFKEWIVSIFGSAKKGVPKAAEDPTKSEPYRSWTDVKDTVDCLRVLLDKECESYIPDKVKPLIVKYFHDVYIKESKEELAEFDKKHDDRLKKEGRELTELQSDIDDDKRAIEELRQAGDKIEKLQKDLEAKYQEEFNLLPVPSRAED